MGIVKSRGGVIDVYVPGVRVKKKGGKDVKVKSHAVDDMWEIAKLATSGEYAGVFIDTWSRMTTSLLRGIAAKDTTSSKTGTARVNLQSDKGIVINHPTQQDYGVLGSTLEDWRVEIWPACVDGVVVGLSGHEKLMASETDEGYVISAYGSLGMEGRIVTKALPGMLVTLLRGIKKRKPGSRRPPRTLLGESTDEVWKCKDRLDVWNAQETECEWPRKKDETPEEHKERIVEEFAALWDEWVEEWLDRDDDTTRGFMGLYADPGWGKTLCLAGLAVSLFEHTEKPSLFADWDSEGATSLPKSLIKPE